MRETPLPDLTVDAAAYRLGVAPATLRAWIRVGRFPAYRMPSGHYRIREEDLPVAYAPARGAHVQAAGEARR